MNNDQSRELSDNSEKEFESSEEDYEGKLSEETESQLEEETRKQKRKTGRKPAKEYDTERLIGQAVALELDGHTTVEIAEILKVGERSIERWRTNPLWEHYVGVINKIQRETYEKFAQERAEMYANKFSKEFEDRLKQGATMSKVNVQTYTKLMGLINKALDEATSMDSPIKATNALKQLPALLRGAVALLDVEDRCFNQRMGIEEILKNIQS